MALPNCPICVKHWSDNGRNMYGYRFLIRDQHIPEAHPTAFSETSLIDISPVNMCPWPFLDDECHIHKHPEGYSSDQPKPGGSDGMASANQQGKRQPMVESDPNKYSDLNRAAAALRLALPWEKDESYDDAFALIERVPELGVSEKEPTLTLWAFNLVYLNASAFTRVAIQNHQWELYMQLPDSYVDKGMQSVEEATKDNILHGRVPASDRHRIALGAVLQMQEDLNWFKEIERLVPPSYKNKRNKDGKTPQEVFTENHKKLRAEAEQWVKGTANSCTVVAVLILAISYPASITVPGGISPDNGRPVLGSEIVFKIFGVANALSFIGACASMLTFLSVLSSRYTEGDFLRALPMKLVVGILSLYMAVASMMVSCTLIQYLNFGPIDEKRWDIIGCAVVVPCFLSVVAMFALGHFSLVAEIIKKTYLSGTLEKRRRSSSFLQKVWTRMRSIAGLWKREGEATIPIFVRK